MMGGLLAGLLAPSVSAAMMGTARAAPGSPLAKIDAHLKRGFSGTVLIAHEGRIVMEKGYGLADRAQRRANGPDTLFDVGSISKQFVATALLQLEERGLLSLEDPISKYLDVPRARAQITLSQMLSHRSGLGYPKNEELDDREPKSFFETFFKDAETLSKPGEKYFYNNLCYCFLSYVIEKVSGEKYEDYLSKYLFQPAGMTSTGFNEPGSVDLSKAATAYDGRAISGTAGLLPNSWGLRGSTGVVSNAGDLHRWTETLRSGAVLSTAAREKLFAPARWARGESPYALGWEVELDRRGRPQRAFHSGLTFGFNSNLTMDLRGGYTVATLSNDARDRFVGTVERFL